MSLSDFFKSPFGRRPEESSTPPPAPPVSSSEEVAPAPRPDPAKVDFLAILEAAGVTAEQRHRVLRAQELLRTLPAEAPAAVKRDVVEAAFKAFDVPTHEIVAAAASEIDALKAFIRGGEEHTQQILIEGNQQISLLESKIAEVKAGMDRTVSDQAMRAQATRDEIRLVQPVLQFFLRDASFSRPSDVFSAPPPPSFPGPASGNDFQGDGVDIQWEAGR